MPSVRIGADQHQQVGVEGGEVAERERPVDHLAAADEQDRGEPELRQEADERVVERAAAASRSSTGRTRAPTLPRKRSSWRSSARERLDHAHAGDVLLDVGGQLGDPLLDLLQRRPRAAPVARGDRAPRTGPGPARARPAPGRRGTSRPRRARSSAPLCSDEDEPVAEEEAHRLQVDGRARHQLAGLLAVEEAELERLQVRVERLRRSNSTPSETRPATSRRATESASRTSAGEHDEQPRSARRSSRRRASTRRSPRPVSHGIATVAPIASAASTSGPDRAARGRGAGSRAGARKVLTTDTYTIGPPARQRSCDAGRLRRMADDAIALRNRFAHGQGRLGRPPPRACPFPALGEGTAEQKIERLELALVDEMRARATLGVAREPGRSRRDVERLVPHRRRGRSRSSSASTRAQRPPQDQVPPRAAVEAPEPRQPEQPRRHAARARVRTGRGRRVPSACGARSSLTAPQRRGCRCATLHGARRRAPAQLDRAGGRAARGRLCSSWPLLERGQERGCAASARRRAPPRPASFIVAGRRRLRRASSRRAGRSSSRLQVARPVEERLRRCAVCVASSLGSRRRRRQQHDDHVDVLEVAERVERELERLAAQQQAALARTACRRRSSRSGPRPLSV